MRRRLRIPSPCRAISWPACRPWLPRCRASRSLAEAASRPAEHPPSWAGRRASDPRRRASSGRRRAQGPPTRPRRLSAHNNSMRIEALRPPGSLSSPFVQYFLACPPILVSCQFRRSIYLAPLDPREPKPRADAPRAPPRSIAAHAPDQPPCRDCSSRETSSMPMRSVMVAMRTSMRNASSAAARVHAGDER